MCSASQHLAPFQAIDITQARKTNAYRARIRSNRERSSDTQENLGEKNTAWACGMMKVMMMLNLRLMLLRIRIMQFVLIIIVNVQNHNTNTDDENEFLSIRLSIMRIPITTLITTLARDNDNNDRAKRVHEILCPVIDAECVCVVPPKTHCYGCPLQTGRRLVSRRHV